MHFLTILMISSQIWSQIISPSTHDKDCSLRAKNSITAYGNDIKVNSTHKHIRRILPKIMKLLLEPKARTNKTNLARSGSNSAVSGSGSDENKGSATVDTSDSTQKYWNLTHSRCDFQRIRCLRAYATGAVCGRTLEYTYFTFPNYCTLEFKNCLLGDHGAWMLAYMGICTEIDLETEFMAVISPEEMNNLTYLKQMYADDSGDITNAVAVKSS